MADQWEQCRQVLRAVRRRLLQKRNVVAVGVGYKNVRGRKTDHLALICSVEVKASKSILPEAEVIPESIDGIPTDVIVTGMLYAQQSRTERRRPAPGV